jgi:hypothetical protein
MSARLRAARGNNGLALAIPVNVELQASNGCLRCHTVIDRSQFQKYIPSISNARHKRREYHQNLVQFYQRL